MDYQINQDIFVIYDMVTHKLKEPLLFTVFINDIHSISHILKLDKDFVDIYKNVIKGKFIEKTENSVKVQIDEKILEVHKEKIKGV